ncbi:MAG: sensor histidine kinase [Promethearchaeota archaeon]
MLIIYQSENILENIWFHLLNPLIVLPIMYIALFKILKIEKSSIEAKIMALILLTILILVEFIVLILMITRGDYLFYFLMYVIGTIIFLYTIFYTIKTIRDFSQNLIQTQDSLSISEEKYRLAYTNVKLYEDIFTHDINNIFQNFTLLFNLFENFKQEMKDKDSFKEINHTIKFQLNRGVELVNNVQVLSEVEMLKPEFTPINLIEVLEDLVLNIKIKIPEDKVEVKLNNNEHLVLVKADKYLSHIFKNLINNGIMHNSSEVKTVSIDTYIEKLNYSRQIRIEILDNGRGLNPAHKQHLRNLFEDNVNSYNRSGLGLLVVKKLTERYKGKIFIEDRIDGDYTKGSKFIVKFPLSN